MLFAKHKKIWSYKKIPIFRDFFAEKLIHQSLTSLYTQESIGNYLEQEISCLVIVVNPIWAADFVNYR